MKLNVYFSDGNPITELSERQQQRFIEELKFLEKIDEPEQIEGMKKALLLLGYEIIDEEGDERNG